VAADGWSRQADRRGQELSAGADLSSACHTEADAEADADADADADAHTGRDADADRRTRRLDARIRR
jgi:hypothetical protein